MLVKRLALAAISMAIGYLITWFIVTVDIQLGPIHLEIAGTTMEQYGVWYSFFTAFTIACAIGVWLDKFMGTEILPK